MTLPSHISRGHVAVAVVGCAALAVVAMVDPGRTALGPPCPLRALTGLDCPLCGATRSTHALANGDLAAALDFNALYVAALPLVLLAAVLWLRSGALPALLRHAVATRAAIGVALAFMVARNLPAFSVLAA